MQCTMCTAHASASILLAGWIHRRHLFLVINFFFRLQPSGDVIALPLRLGVKGLKHNMREEGLFRVGPSIPTFKKLKAYIDTGATEEAVLQEYRDPHLYTALIKYYLRELPDPLFSSQLEQDWSVINKIDDDNKRMKEIDSLFEKLPKANRENIEFLFEFLAHLNSEEVSNKMTVSNLIMVLGPNLLWDKKSKKTVEIPRVYCSLFDKFATKTFLEGRKTSLYRSVYQKQEIWETTKKTDPINVVEDYFGCNKDILKDEEPTERRRKATRETVMQPNRNAIDGSTVICGPVECTETAPTLPLPTKPKLASSSPVMLRRNTGRKSFVGPQTIKGRGALGTRSTLNEEDFDEDSKESEKSPEITTVEKRGAKDWKETEVISLQQVLDEGRTGVVDPEMGTTVKREQRSWPDCPTQTDADLKLPKRRSNTMSKLMGLKSPSNKNKSKN